MKYFLFFTLQGTNKLINQNVFYKKNTENAPVPRENSCKYIALQQSRGENFITNNLGNKKSLTRESLEDVSYKTCPDLHIH
ncbi:MAG: hypothetical protein EBS74_10320, partial [Flavobacteriia bacterium]|nr:hypothetical protein [Flavobacteriia bacterium]